MALVQNQGTIAATVGEPWRVVRGRGAVAGELADPVQVMISRYGGVAESDGGLAARQWQGTPQE